MRETDKVAIDHLLPRMNKGQSILHPITEDTLFAEVVAAQVEIDGLLAAFEKKSKGTKFDTKVVPREVVNGEEKESGIRIWRTK